MRPRVPPPHSSLAPSLHAHNERPAIAQHVGGELNPLTLCSLRAKEVRGLAAFATPFSFSLSLSLSLKHFNYDTRFVFIVHRAGGRECMYWWCCGYVAFSGRECEAAGELCLGFCGSRCPLFLQCLWRWGCEKGAGWSCGR